MAQRQPQSHPERWRGHTMRGPAASREEKGNDDSGTTPKHAWGARDRHPDTGGFGDNGRGTTDAGSDLRTLERRHARTGEDPVHATEGGTQSLVVAVHENDVQEQLQSPARSYGTTSGRTFPAHLVRASFSAVRPSTASASSTPTTGRGAAAAVESRTRAPVIGSGGDSVAVVPALGPAPLTTSPVPAHQAGRAARPPPMV